MTAERPASPGPIVGERDAEGFRDVRFGGGFNRSFGTMRVRSEGDARSRVRVSTGADQANVNGAIHGGFLLGFVDQAIFVGPAENGRLAVGSAVTLTLATQFVGAGHVGVPLDCVVDITSETGRLLFLSGQLEQDGRPVLSFQATLRKLSRRPDGPPA